MADTDPIFVADASTPEQTWEMLRVRITVLSERVWENRNQWPQVEAWLANFDGRAGFEPKVERLHALFLLSQFLFIGSAETRVLLRAVYRDLFLIPLIQEVRSSLSGCRDPKTVKEAVDSEMAKTRFLGVGNPSESGVHLLYFFRQENKLSKKNFLDSAAVFSSVINEDGKIERELADPDIERYIFVDDVCGSGKTAVKYSKGIISEILSLQPSAKVCYLAMFATQKGIEKVRATKFGSASAAVFELDDSYRCLSPSARILFDAPDHIDATVLRKVTLTYGTYLRPGFPGGWDDNQLLLGFQHNTPNNTLPIMWAEGSATHPWTPAFKRYAKM
ncbi:phosphoribosyltransferase-like protein [Parvularcula dongshanensis]|uniref:PRTase-CE domain-containing protein n=1 Tax=Parvularcula dongshanensis TaxID=1173995 RepID=A0A840I546_9PROT|nr:hypothetical protein [Parvularcula dongshanensis]MBB4659324.1 hypothetical protein [Parvularcula dongshanensis]